jgi:LacI family transcriptional regulator
MDNKIYEVAKIAGVSISTVSRVFNKTANVRTSTRDKVLAAANRVNYRPKIIARKEYVAIIVPGENMVAPNIYESYVLKCITKELIANKINFEIIPSSQAEELQQSFASAVITICYNNSIYKSLLQLKNVPVIAINNIVKNIHSVSSDHKNGIIQAVKLLHANGHSKISFVQTGTGSWGTDERKAGYYEAIKDRGEINPEEYWTIPKENKSLLETIAQIARKGITAIIFDSEDMALPAYHALKLLNYSIPDDISVITLECSKISDYLLPAPTTIKQPMEKIAEFTVNTIQQLIQNPNQPIIRKLFDNEIIKRDSVCKII